VNAARSKKSLPASSLIQPELYMILKYKLIRVVRNFSLNKNHARHKIQIPFQFKRKSESGFCTIMLQSKIKNVFFLFCSLVSVV
jgi:hypothetical protein